jgi:hypothetical protein
LFATTHPTTQHKRHTDTRQAQPSLQRVAEIQAALKAHGYEPGETWEETKEVCRRIADEHQWQTDHAPDARVLILLGLAGPHADPAVTQLEGGRLDKDQRTEAARLSARNLTSQQTTRAEAISKAAVQNSVHTERTTTSSTRRATVSKKKVAAHRKHRNLNSRQT